MQAALYLHSHSLHRILYVPMDFFDTTPKGRILSRFSTDINCIDNTLPMNLKQTLVVGIRVGQLHDFTPSFLVLRVSYVSYFFFVHNHTIRFGNCFTSSVLFDFYREVAHRFGFFFWRASHSKNVKL